MKRYTLLLPLVVLVCQIACGPSQKKITIAIMTKLQHGSIVGSSEVNAARLFLEDRRLDDIEIYPIDDGWEVEKARQAYHTIRQKGIDILITSHVSTCAVAISDSINKDPVLAFVTGSTTDLLSNRDDNIFRNTQDVQHEQRSIAEYVKGTPYRQLLIIRDTANYAYTEPALKYFLQYLSRSDIPYRDIDINQLDLPALEKWYREIDFELVYLLIGGYKSNAGAIAQLIHQTRPACRFLFTPWMKTPAILETAGDAIESCIMPSHYPPHGSNPNVDQYVARFKSRFGAPPTFISLNVYNALEILYTAIAAGHRQPAAIKRYLMDTRRFETTFGTVEFNEFGDVEAPLYFITDIAGEF